MTWLVFENEGAIDMRAAWTFGVNVKNNDNPIGFFGTGLKYAIAIILRTNQEIVIQSGLHEYRFVKVEQVIRDKAFDFVGLQRTDQEDPDLLGFTTDLGKTWEPWMAYRELACNCRDENGTIYQTDEIPEPTADVTRILVRGETMLYVHVCRAEFILESEPIEVIDNVEIHPGSSTSIFYRGLRVANLKDGKRTAHTYNLTNYVELTEDRTAKYAFMLEWHIRDAILKMSNPDMAAKAMSARKTSYEANLDFEESNEKPSPAFIEAADKLASDSATDTNPTALKVYKAHTRSTLSPDTVQLDGLQKQMFEAAKNFCRQIGFDITYDIVVAESLGRGTIGMAEDGRIYLSWRCFDMGTKQVAATLIEEFLHLKHGVKDESREMQDLLLLKMVSLGEELIGEAL